MNPAPSLSHAARLRVITIILTLLVLGAGAVSVYTVVRSSQESLRAQHQDETLPLGQLDLMSRGLTQLQLALSQAVLRGDKAGAESAWQLAKASLELVDRTWDDYMAHATHPDAQGLAQALAVSREAYVSQGVVPTMDALRAGDARKAQRLIAARTTELYTPVAQGLEALAALHGNAALSSHAAAVQRHATLRSQAIAAIVGILLLCYVTSLLLLRRLGRAAAAAATVQADPASNGAQESRQDLIGSQHAIEQTAPAEAAPQADASTDVWDGKDRRGPNRAKNVTRPKFGAPESQPAAQVPAPQEDRPQPLITGTDGPR